LHDGGHIASNISQARHLMQRAGVSEQALVQAAYEARSITLDTPHITKRAADGFPNKMPFFFAVVADLLGLKDTPEETAGA
jgi:hypothetical protein